MILTMNNWITMNRSQIVEKLVLGQEVKFTKVTHLNKN